MKINKYVELKGSEVHGKGVFAITKIPKDTKIIQYIGRKITKKESEKIADEQLELNKKDNNHGAVYIFELNKKYDLDGNTPDNHAKYINHSCNPNCESINEDNEIWIYSIKEIQKGEELSFDYGYDPDSYEDHPCKCGANNCIGYIVAEKHRDKIKK